MLAEPNQVSFSPKDSHHLKSLPHNAATKMCVVGLRPVTCCGWVVASGGALLLSQVLPERLIHKTDEHTSLYMTTRDLVTRKNFLLYTDTGLW